tara:strand:+ start:41 stop:697 length:657 start_codon:yes stop_codon:yes gene_type:complete
MKQTTTFSAYWNVENNPKLTAKKGHIKHAQNRNLDYFVCSKDQIESFNNKINLEFSDLPSLPYLKNLTNFCKSRDTVFTKFGQSIQSDTFLKLATIWTSKILIFQEISNHIGTDYLMWVDCVIAKNLDKIACSYSDKCCINRYGKLIEGKDFSGILKNTLPPTKISASVIKLPRLLIPEFTKRYIECLQFTDDEFIIYDEEIVLTIMNQKYPQLFNLF